MSWVLGISSTFIWIGCGRDGSNGKSDLAGFKGTTQLSFTATQISLHQNKIDAFLLESAECLESHLRRHQDFFKKHGISAYYGDQSSFAKKSQQQKIRELKSLGLSPKLLDEMTSTSCVGLAMTCLGKGFEKTNQKDIWEIVNSFTKKNDLDGTSLQHALQKLGWKTYYWNPQISKNEVWDAQEKANDPNNNRRFWGYHAYRWSTVNGPGRNYYSNVVDNFSSLVNFGVQPPLGLKKVPFFIGTAHTGYHVFPGKFGEVMESHSTRAITDPQTMESSPFNPLQNGGGPRGAYRTGLMAIPPGYDFKKMISLF